MLHLLTQTMDLQRSTITNNLGTEKTTRASLWSFPCRRSRSRDIKYSEMVRKEVDVSDKYLDLYTTTDCPIAKNDRVVLPIGTFTVQTDHTHIAAANAHHIYCKLHLVE